MSLATPDGRIGTMKAIAWVLALAACGGEQAPAPLIPQQPKQIATAAPTPTVLPSAPKDDAIPATTSNKEALAAYEAGLYLFDNNRSAEAHDEFAKAHELDPHFSSAIAMEGRTTRNQDGDQLIADAIQQLESLPEAERVFLEFLQADIGDDRLRARDLATKLTTLVPKAWRPWRLLGNAQRRLGRDDDAIVSYKKAIALDANAASVYNSLGYAELENGKLDEALGHIRKYVELLPKEANSHDSLGEILLLGGNLDEAAKSFERSTTLAPKLAEPWDGLALVRLYQGDYTKAYEAFDKERAAAQTLEERGDVARNVAIAQLAQKKVSEALGTLDAYDAEGTAERGGDFSLSTVFTRSWVLIEGGRPAEAIKLLAPLSLASQRHQGYSHQLQAIAYARLGKAAEADKARTSAEDALRGVTDLDAREIVAIARGEASMTKGDAKGAATAFERCRPSNDWCALERMKAQEKAGDKAAAKATKEALLKTRRRNPWSFFAYARVK